MHVEKKALAHAQKVLRTVAPTRVARPVLGHVLIQDGYAYATDLQHTVRVRIGEPGHEPFLVPWSAFKALRGDVDMEPLEVGEDEAPRVRLGNATVVSYAAADFPPLPEVPQDLRHVDAENLLRHLRRCEAARANEKKQYSRPMLTAVGVEKSGELIAADSYAVYWSTDGCAMPLRAATSGIGNVPRVTLPGETYKVLSAFGWTAATVGAGVVGDTAVLWYFQGPDGGAAWLRSLEGNYLYVREIVLDRARNFPTSITVGRAELAAALAEALKTVAKDEPHAVVLTATPGAVRLRAKGEYGRSEYETDLPATVTGQPVTFGIDAKLTLPLLEVVAEGQDTVVLEYSGPETVFRVAVRDGVWHQMPLALPEDY